MTLDKKLEETFDKVEKLISNDGTVFVTMNINYQDLQGEEKLFEMKIPNDFSTNQYNFFTTFGIIFGSLQNEKRIKDVDSVIVYSEATITIVMAQSKSKNPTEAELKELALQYKDYASGLKKQEVLMCYGIDKSSDIKIKAKKIVRPVHGKKFFNLEEIPELVQKEIPSHPYGDPDSLKGFMKGYNAMLINGKVIPHDEFPLPVEL